MHRVSFLATLVLSLGSTQALAECNSIGCVRPTNALERLTKTAERTLSVMRLTEPAKAPGFCDTGNCIEPAVTPVPENCGSAGCTTPQPKSSPAAATANDATSSTLVTDTFDAVAAPRLPATVPWVEWTERWGFGGLYKSSTMD
jgi:hypothetical protein